MTPSTMDFGRRHIHRDEVIGKRVLEVGAYDVNGSFRSIAQSYGPAEYVGIDIAPGPGVDRVCNALDAPTMFGEFDVVICTEVMEHEQDWRGLVRALKELVRIGGILMVTTRSPGFAYHPYPEDYWRFTLDDFRAIFADMVIEALEADPAQPGVFLRARRTNGIMEPPDLLLAPPA